MGRTPDRPSIDRLVDLARKRTNNRRWKSEWVTLSHAVLSAGCPFARDDLGSRCLLGQQQSFCAPLKILFAIAAKQRGEDRRVHVPPWTGLIWSLPVCLLIGWSHMRTCRTVRSFRSDELVLRRECLSEYETLHLFFSSLTSCPKVLNIVWRPTTNGM